MSKHMFNVFKDLDQPIGPSKITSKIDGENVPSFRPVKPVLNEITSLKKTSGIHSFDKKPLAQRNDPATLNEERFEPKSIISDDDYPDIEDIYENEIEVDDFEDIWPKSKRYTKDDIVQIIKSVLPSAATPEPNINFDMNISLFPEPKFEIDEGYGDDVDMYSELSVEDLCIDISRLDEDDYQ